MAEVHAEPSFGHRDRYPSLRSAIVHCFLSPRRVRRCIQGSGARRHRLFPCGARRLRTGRTILRTLVPEQQYRRRKCREYLSRFRGGGVDHVGPALVARRDDRGVDRNASQEGNSHILRHPPAASPLEYLGLLPAVGTIEPAHVLDHAQDVKRELPAEVDALPHVDQRHILGRRDDHGSVGVTDELCDGQRLVPRSGR